VASEEALAAERRTAAPFLHAARSTVDRYLVPARRRAANPPLLQMNDGTDGQVDGHPTVT